MAETVYTKSELIAVLRDFSREFQIPAVYLLGPTPVMKRPLKAMWIL